jgi:UDP-N-acetyl-2-amino-2-deoxyglucuronate dehydrogenase
LELKNFALIGGGGYIAPRHMQAIRDTGNTLLAMLDPSDSVGVIDSYFPDADFFTEFERFDRHVYKLSRNVTENRIHYVSICSPNYLHDSHMRFALRSGADAVCEKPLVLNPWNIDALLDLEKETGRRVNTILQLRLHPAIIAFRDRVRSSNSGAKEDVDLTYITSRGHWYHESWKGNEGKSGGIATNIGVHFFDMLGFVYGKLQHNVVHLRTPTKAAGYLEYEHARVRWFLSLDVNDVPAAEREKGKRTYRALTANGQSVEFSDGFTDLHTRCYEEILAGRGFGLEENRQAIETVASIRNAPVEQSRDLMHQLVQSL